MNAHRLVLVSIHDVMPATFGKVMKIEDHLKSRGVSSITFFIVPGGDWQREEIAVLKRLQKEGHELAAHGWLHQAARFRSFRHRLHGLLISKNEAEHMALEPQEILALLEKSHGWFRQWGLSPPKLYIPPAWALGRISLKALSPLPYRYYETLFGVYNAATFQWTPMALCGYMADTPFRAMLLKATNRINAYLSLLPLRVAIHPEDLNLPLAGDLLDCLEAHPRHATYHAFLSGQRGNKLLTCS